ncbi:Phosphate acetyltransferase [hydrothermal vent metagenome]|uniref:Phosphate acetyltransferase n=1 Tax=hydrothermal vent metagenome TaxID=652676 RepID=A0A1W1D312_9ZZZZ
MKITSLYITTQTRHSGMLFVAMGMMEILKKNLHRVAFFRPIIPQIKDNDIQVIQEYYQLEMEYEECYGFDLQYVEDMIAQGKKEELLQQLITQFKKLESSYDFVLCEGLHSAYFNDNIHYDLNLEIAKNFATPIINVINAKNKNNQVIIEDVNIEYQHILQNGCEHFATFINRVEKQSISFLEVHLPIKAYFLEEVKELGFLNLLDVIESLQAKEIFVKKEDYTRYIKEVRVGALSVNNFLKYIQEGDLIITPADRSDIILALFGALYSHNLPNVSAIVFPFDMDMDPSIQQLLLGLKDIHIPIIGVTTDTYETAKNISNIYSKIRPNSTRKIALALGLFSKSIDTQEIEQKIASSHKEIMTPLMFEYKLFANAQKKKKRIVLPESEDERILRAVEVILMRDVALITLLGKKEEVLQRGKQLGLDLSLATIIDHETSPWQEEFVQTFYELRKHKGLSYQNAKDTMLSRNYFATMMVHLGYVDGMVSGAVGSTGETILPALQIIKTKPNISLVSSVFFMCLDTEVLVYGDCAINKDPDADELALIAIASAQTAQAFGMKPKVAMLSYSTGESGSGRDVEKVKEATNKVKELAPSLLVEGPIQYDAAINKEVAKKKLPNSQVAGEANVLIFPDLNTGNNTYKAVQRSSGATAIGPVLQGLNKPVNDLSRGCLVEDIINTVAITAIQAGMGE